MSFAATIVPAVLDTILGRVALLFLSGANEDLAVARQAAAHMLAAYQPETEDELRLAGQIVSFSLHALEALSQAVTPDMPLNKILRLRSGAVSLSRESHKAERRLEQRQQARRDGIPAEPIEATAVEPTRPQIDKAIALIEATRQEVQDVAPNTAPIWSKAYRQQKAARRITENLQKNQAAHAAALIAKADTTAARPL
jgi:hypothetical protein